MNPSAEPDRVGPCASRRHAQQVRRYFAEPDRYLANDARLAIRRLACRQMVHAVDRSLILDIGCGDGSMSLPLLTPQSRLTLLDSSRPMLDRAKGNTPEDLESNVELVCLDLMELEPAHRYTLVLCLGVLAHVPDVGDALARIASLLGPGGHCLLHITDTSRWLGRINHAYYDRRSRARADHGYSLRRLDSPTLITDAEALGLRLVERRNYSLSVPGLRRLPNTLQFRLERGFLNSRLSRHGGESLLLLVKQGTEGTE